jgi:hypothetical protein
MFVADMLPDTDVQLPDLTGLLEIHLSHNGITSNGARTLLGTAPVERTVDR